MEGADDPLFFKDMLLSRIKCKGDTSVYYFWVVTDMHSDISIDRRFIRGVEIKVFKVIISQVGVICHLPIINYDKKKKKIDQLYIEHLFLLVP